jgi:hypothetical protein
LNEELLSKISKSSMRLKPIDNKTLIARQKNEEDRNSETSKVYKEKILTLIK